MHRSLNFTLGFHVSVLGFQNVIFIPANEMLCGKQFISALLRLLSTFSIGMWLHEQPTWNAPHPKRNDDDVRIT